jgi:HSP20 family protein
MANVTKKSGDQPQASSKQLAVNQPQAERGELVRRDDPMQFALRDPFQLIRDLMTNPFGMLQTLPWGGFGRDLAWNPGFEVRETDDAFVFKGDLPGIKSEDLDISLTGNRLEVSGKREQESETNEGTFHTYERSYGNFCRSFALPETADVDNVRCDLKDGVLTMLVPKKPGSQSRKIQIGSGSKS